MMIWKGAGESEAGRATVWRRPLAHIRWHSRQNNTWIHIYINYIKYKSKLYYNERVAGLLVRLQEPRGRRWLRERACSSTWRRVVPKSFRLRWMTASADVDGAWCGSGGAPTPRAWELNSSEAPPRGPEPTNQRPSAPPPPATTTAARLPSIHNHPGRRSHQLIRDPVRRLG